MDSPNGSPFVPPDSTTSPNISRVSTPLSELSPPPDDFDDTPPRDTPPEDNNFRILIIGRANAGKTTILKRVCNSVGDPEIFDSTGKKLNLDTVKESEERGLHDIDNQLIFKSNPEFIFHDSRGFESGSFDEMGKVKVFLEKRAASDELSNQVHVVWYCLPTDTNRPLLEADEQFFEISGTGKVPVIAIFTKFDGLVTEAFNRLRANGKGRKEARIESTKLAEDMLTTNFIQPLKATNFAPAEYVRLDDMRLEASSCFELISKTVNALNDETLTHLFVLVKQNSIDLCVFSAMNEMLKLKSSRDNMELDAKNTWSYFTPELRYTQQRSLLQQFSDEVDELKIDTNVMLQRTRKAHVAILEEKFPAWEESIQTPSGRAEFLAMTCICVGQAFTETPTSASARDFGLAFSMALDAYVGSTTEAEVINEIGEVIRENEKENGKSLRTAKTQEERKNQDVQAQKLLGIIKTHRLRISTETTR